jgi:hypothetical protein
MPTKTRGSKSKNILNKGGAWSYGRRRKFYWLLAAVLVILLAWLIWRKPMARAYDAFLGRNTASQLAPSTLASQPAVATADTPGSSSQSSQGKTGSDTSTSHDSTTSTTSTTGTTTTPATTQTTTTTTTATPPTTTPTTSTGLNNLYTEVDTGQSKDQLISLAGSTPNTCNLIPLLNEEVCTWLDNGQAVSVTLLNGQVIGKTQVGL